MMQGDSYGIPVEIRNSKGEVVTAADVSDVEIVVGGLRKSYKKGEVKYSDNKFIFPLTQEETFRFSGSVKAQVRVVWPSGDVDGVFLGNVEVATSLSKEVL